MNVYPFSISNSQVPYWQIDESAFSLHVANAMQIMHQLVANTAVIMHCLSKCIAFAIDSLFHYYLGLLI